MSSALPESSEISDLNSDIFNSQLVESLPLPSIQSSSSSKNATRTSWYSGDASIAQANIKLVGELLILGDILIRSTQYLKVKGLQLLLDS